MRVIVRHVAGVDQRDQDVDVEEMDHGSSSRRTLTVSSVTGADPGLHDNSGIPLRSPHSAF